MKQGFITKELRHRKEFSFSRGNSEIYFRDCTKKWNQCFGSTNEQLCFCYVYVYAYVERVTSVVKAAQDELSEFVLLMYVYVAAAFTFAYAPRNQVQF